MKKISNHETKNILSCLKIPFERKYSSEKDISKGTFIRTGHFSSSISPISEILE